MAVDVIKCHDALQEAVQWTTAGQGLQRDGVVAAACLRVLAEIDKGAPPLEAPEPAPTVEE